MPGMIRVRATQAVMGIVYALLAAIAVARSETPLAVLFAAAIMIGSYLTGRTIPDFYVPQNAIFRVCGVGLMVMTAGFAVDLVGGSKAIGWALVVMAYCAGNRLKAAGLGASG
jgi:hypothetical protein